MARRSNQSAKAQESAGELPIRAAHLEPIRVVERELTRPDGTKVVVEVPVYPPFRLENDLERGARSSRKAPARRGAAAKAARKKAESPDDPAE